MNHIEDRRRGWIRRAPCRSNPDAFFPKNEHTKQCREAKLTCQTLCPRQGRCAADALRTGETDGVHGGVYLPGIRRPERLAEARELLAAIAGGA